MAVYVDDMYKYPIGSYGRMKMSHMISDSSDELLRMADAIGVNRKWIQHPGTLNEHFDIAKSSRARAVELGAIEITYREYAKMIEQRCASQGVHWALASVTVASSPKTNDGL